MAEILKPEAHELAVYPVTRLYDRGITVTTSPLLDTSIGISWTLRIHPLTAKKLDAG